MAVETIKNKDGTVTLKDNTEDTKEDSPEIDLNIEPEPPKDMSVKLNDLMEKAKYLSRMSEKGIINEKTGSSMSVRDNGQINLSSGKYSQYKLNPNGRVSELSLESKTTTNRRIIETDDIIINNHKLNPDLWQLTDFKQVSLPYTEKAVIGNMTLQAHIMVKAWDQDLGRYMLIRRPARIRLFSPRINVPDINTGLLINDPLRIDEDILALTDKGYQVNAKISDKNSLIGKEGVNRDSSWSSEDTMDSAGGNSGGNMGSATNSGSLGGGNLDTDIAYKTIRSYGYNAKATCAIMGNINQESHFDTHADNGSHRGICQWDITGRWANLELFAQSSKRDSYDGLLQLDFMYYEAKNTRYPEENDVSKMNEVADESVEKATLHWLKWFEGASGQAESDRISYANQFYEKYKNK